MMLNVFVLILCGRLWPTASAETLPKFNKATGHNCWLDSIPTRFIIAKNELLCSMKCTMYDWESYLFESDTCEILESSVLSSEEGVVIYREYANITMAEIANGKPIFATRQYLFYTPELSMDHDIDTFYHSNNAGTEMAWFMVDLQGGFNVSKIRVFPRNHDHPDHEFKDTQVLLGDTSPSTPGNFSEFTLVDIIVGPVSPIVWQEIDVLPPRCSRYVALYKYKLAAGEMNLLQIAEIEVYTLY